MEARECESCGNVYDKAFEVKMGERTHVFDSFECAITALAPVCTHCQTRIVGHGVEVDNVMYCCAHCAKSEGKDGVVDRASDDGLLQTA